MEDEVIEIIHGNEVIMQFAFGFTDSMALKCAVELRIANIFHSHGQPIMLRQIISPMGSPKSMTDIACMEQIMRFLSHRKIFNVDYPSDDGETLYGLTLAFWWILCSNDMSLTSWILLETDRRIMASWKHLSDRVIKGEDAFEKANGLEFWEYMGENLDFFKLFNDGLGCTASISLKVLLEIYKDGFEQMVGTFVDVGGRTGAPLAEIVKAHPHIRGINYDMQHVIGTTPKYHGVSHVGGNMFESILTVDAIFIMPLLHDWGDQDCIKILKKCLESITQDTRKLILVETILSSEANEKYDAILALDLLMMAHFDGGKERNDREWKALLDVAGFKRVNIIKVSLLSIIEAYPF